ncbi:pilus assembly protein PilM [Desulfobacula phenolica]|uniref:General secretion pathway protein L n=1 Tax=Desulfobacula phenolica TaxID=90732 RepID=A0A1H2DNY1_9BACT|nr:pilus assembly protein PilM [Desulfobacula phenolica]SDT84600.1 general secretion pathway protein L [Desulfobacula phenolica]
MSSRVLTIDIQQNQIASVLLSHGLKGIRVVEAACITIAQNTNGQKTNGAPSFQEVKDALKQILIKMNTRYDRCIISIPGICFFFRTIDLPFKNRKKNSRIFSFELERYLPWPVEEIEADFCMLHKNFNSSMDTNMAGVAGIQNSCLEPFKNLFDQCGVHPDVVTVGSGYAAAFVYAGTADLPDFYCFIHAEPLMASIHLVRFGEMAFSRAFLLDSGHPVGSVKTNLIHTFLSFNESIGNQLELKDIIISGTASFLKELCGDIEKEMAVPVHEFDLFKLEKLSFVSGQFSDSHTNFYQNAIAMGINEIKGAEIFNFSRQVSNFTLFYQENKFNITAVAVLSVLLFLAWTINPIIQINRMQNSIEQLDKKVIGVFKSCFPDVKTIVDPVHQMQVKVSALQENKNTNFLGEHLLCIDVLNEISKSLPPSLDIVFSRLVRTEDQLLLSGSADQFNTIDNMKNKFENITLFRGVDIQSASMDKTDKRVKFNLKIVL